MAFRSVAFLIGVALMSGASVAAPLRVNAPPIARFAQPARVRARRHKPADIPARGAKVRDAAAALGLRGITSSGTDDVPSALYGNAQSGKIAGRSASEAAQNFLHGFAAVYGLSPADIANAATTERPGFITGHRETIIEQRVAGRPLYGARLHLHLGPDGEFVAAVGDLYGNLHWAGNAKLSAAEASLRAASLIDRILPPQGIGPVRGARIEDAVVSEVAYPIGDEAHPAFLYSNIVASNGMDVFDVVVDGISGAILEVVSRTAYLQGQVFQNASGQPQSPQPSLTPGVAPPTPNPPAYVLRVPISFGSFLTTGATTLSGNLANVREYQSWTGGQRTSSSGNAISSATGDFLFPLTIGAGPQPDIRNYPQATGTNLFYLLNYLHDYFYPLGFDEAHGNFQGSDPVVGFVQQGSGLAGHPAYTWDNANMVTPPDGQSPFMAMFVFGNSGTTPPTFVADSALDPDVVFHEFTHGVTGRLDTNSLPYSAQPGAINEGNSDFFALNIQVTASAPANGAYPLGSYSVQDFASGIRHYAYSTNTLVNPLTYANLATIDGFAEVHNDGEIWTSALWQMRGALIAALGFTEGTTRAAQLDIDALQLLPANPTFVDFRNAILAADGARYFGADTTQIWNGFAIRGLGALADGGIDGYSIHALPDQSVSSTAARIRLWESSFIAGETVRMLIDDSNAAGTSVRLTTSSGDHETVNLGAKGPVWAGNIPTQSGAPVIGSHTLELTPGDIITATITDSNPGAAIPVLTATAAVHAPYSITTVPSLFNPADAATLLFHGDEATTYADLAFPFPFYGQNFSRIYVNDNGQVAFLSAPFIRQQGISDVGSPPVIAPFSTDLDCNSPYGVYFYSGADRFTARWQCVEYSTGNPVNAAVTLFPGGSMRFDYGPGNILTGNDYYTLAADVATVGLNRGTDTFSQAVAGYDGLKDLHNAASVVIAAVADQNIATCPSVFTNPTLVAGVTAIKRIHFDETRTCINALRTFAGLPHYTFTPSTLTGAVTAATIMDMRSALDPALPLLGRPAVSYGRITITPGMSILTSDLNEIRNATK
jgi:hypothetical protein